MIHLGDEKIPWQKGMTISEFLAKNCGDREYAVIKINGKYVSKPNFDTFEIPDDAEIFLIPMIAGG